MYSKVQESNQKLKIGYSLGDLGGIGEEIFQKFIKKNSRKDIEIVLIDEFLDYKKLQEKVETGKASQLAGEHSYRVLEKADLMLKAGELDYLITGPVAKESLWMAGIQCSGQTELLAKLNNLSRDEIEMFFVLDDIKVVLATRHIPIKDVPKVLHERLAKVIKNSSQALKNIWGIEDGKIAIAALNPHAGENGIIGLEENKFIKPLMQELKDNYDLSGPFPADTLFAQVAQVYLKEIENGKKQKPIPNPQSLIPYSLYIAAYHDQALPLVKGLGGLRAINLTAGLPYIRLSVDHGTGFDIVNRGIASAEGLEACTDYALKLAKLKAKKLEKTILDGNLG